MRCHRPKTAAQHLTAAVARTRPKALVGEVGSRFTEHELMDTVLVCVSCRVPDDCIDPKRRALFVSRAVMRGLIEQL